MWRYVIKRVVLAVFSVFIITTLTFFLMNAIPGGPFASEKAIPANVQAALEKRFNLDKPVFEQYLLYMKNILHGDFGVSMKTGRDVSRIIGEGFIPVITYVGPMIAYIITGSLVGKPYLPSAVWVHSLLPVLRRVIIRLSWAPRSS